MRFHIPNSPRNRDIWSSANGITWEADVTGDKRFERVVHQVMSHGDHICVLDGSGSDPKTREVKPRFLKSSDGKNREDATPEWVPFARRSGHQIVKFREVFYMIGGSELSSDGAFYHKNDVWSSTNGINWNLVTSNAAFATRHRHQVVVFKDKLFLIAGLGNKDEHKGEGSSEYDDIWSSTDGKNWVRVHKLNSVAFPWRKPHQVTQKDGRVYLFGGNDSRNSDSRHASVRRDLKSDVWSSTDGASWTEITPSAAFPPRYQHQVEVLGDALYLIGGFVPLEGFRYANNDVWKSTDGANWVEVTTVVAKFNPSRQHRVVNFKDTLYLTGGWNPGNLLTSQVWSSTNGKDWELNLSVGFEAP